MKVRSLSLALDFAENEAEDSLPAFVFLMCSYWYFQDRCKNTASTHCDFSVLSKYGDHTVRVRTELADEHSEWVNVTFCPVEDSKPFISLFVTSSNLTSLLALSVRRLRRPSDECSTP